MRIGIQTPRWAAIYKPKSPSFSLYPVLKEKFPRMLCSDGHNVRRSSDLNKAAFFLCINLIVAVAFKRRCKTRRLVQLVYDYCCHIRAETFLWSTSLHTVIIWSWFKRLVRIMRCHSRDRYISNI